MFKSTFMEQMMLLHFELQSHLHTDYREITLASKITNEGNYKQKHRSIIQDFYFMTDYSRLNI